AAELDGIGVGITVVGRLGGAVRELGPQRFVRRKAALICVEADAVLPLHRRVGGQVFDLVAKLVPHAHTVSSPSPQRTMIELAWAVSPSRLAKRMISSLASCKASFV